MYLGPELNCSDAHMKLDLFLSGSWRDVFFFCCFFSFIMRIILNYPWLIVFSGSGWKRGVHWSALLTHSKEVLGLNPLWSFPLSTQVISGYFGFSATFKGIRGVQLIGEYKFALSVSVNGSLCSAYNRRHPILGRPSIVGWMDPKQIVMAYKFKPGAIAWFRVSFYWKIITNYFFKHI